MSKLEQPREDIGRSRRRTTGTVRPASTYDRLRDLPRLAYIDVEDCRAAERSVADHLRLLAKLEKALRRERRNGLRGAWPYDPGRHRGLAAAVREEFKLLRTRLRSRTRREAETRS